MQKIEEQKKIVCPSCGGNKFKILVEQVVYDATNMKGSWKEDYLDLTMEKDKVLEVVCVKCGKRILEKYVEKPISKKAWKFWASYLVDYIMGFEHYAVNGELAEEDNHEAFLKGITKGMWTIYNLIEAMMVQDKLVRGRRKNN